MKAVAASAAVAALVALGLSRPPFASAAPAHGGRILVRTVDGRPSGAVAGAHLTARLAHVGIDVLSVADVGSALAAYRATAGVAWAEPDGTVAAAAAPNDPLYAQQWYLHPAGRATLDWEPAYPAHQGAGALVAVVDTGYQTGGSDQPANLRMDLARNMISGGADVADDNGHGTFVANIIAEATGNGVGAAGVAPGASIVPVKALGADGTGDLSTVAAGIDYAISIHAQVINLSLAGDISPALCSAVGAAAATSVVVAAAGNDATAVSTHNLDYPAACPGVLSAGSVAYDGSRPAYANTGCGLDVVAPGGDDLNLADPAVPRSDWVVQQSYDADPADGATFGTFQYFAEEGTSMSAAEVTGEVADLIGTGASPAQARRLVVGTARPVGSPGVSPTFGAGVADVASALAALGRVPTLAPPARGYRVVSTTGGLQAFGDACAAGDQGHVGVALTAPVVGAAARPSGTGYWMVARDGGIFTFGDAAFFGSTGAIHLNQPIVGMAATPTGNGYWLVASDGGIFSFGDAAFFGSTGAIHLNQPIVGMAATPTGNGYWLVASDGGIFSFGDAAFFGSTGAIRLNRPIVTMASTPSGRGYWLVASDGGIFDFGDAPFEGSAGAEHLVSPIVGMAPTSDGAGYTLAAADGGVFTFGDAPFYGSAAGGGASVAAVIGDPWPGF